ncbi:DUF6970 domain-containing protein [Marivirga sp.]|uniref:DUF6970 domain-containing protein n=1 Tax=Marivirga sp. TaxID=2018662 RepID=UPI003DA723B8
MKKLTVFISMAVLFISCEKEDILINTPECIKDQIEDIAKGDVWNPPAKIYSYQYEGQTVYYFPSRCCDIASSLYDAECNLLCSPDGGLSGNGDGQCSDFHDLKTDEKLIWEDKRE